MVEERVVTSGFNKDIVTTSRRQQSTSQPRTGGGGSRGGQVRPQLGFGGTGAQRPLPFASQQQGPSCWTCVSRMVTSVLGSPTFSAIDLMASGVDLTHVFRLVATLCECGSVVATSAEVCEGVDVGQLVVGDVVVEQPVVSGVDSPWQAAAAKMDALPTRPAIDHERLTPGACMLDNRSDIFRLVSPTGQVYKPDQVLLDSGAQPLMLGKAACIGLGCQSFGITGLA
ncbi:unnamed protein product [Sphagnum tenellum]